MRQRMGPYELLADLEVLLTSSKSIVSTGDGDLRLDVTGGGVELVEGLL